MNPRRFQRRDLMKAATVGLAGASAVPAVGQPAAAAADHDHAGDRLGEDEPVESIHANSVSVRDLDLRSTILVFEHGTRWVAFESDSQDVVAEDDDGVRVVNDALDEVGRFGEVRVVADAAGSTLESATTLDFPHFDTRLVLERGVTFEYQGDEEAVRAGGNNSQMVFDVIDANGAPYCIRDVGLGPGATVGNTLRGASESLFFLDSDDRHVAAGQYVNVREFDCGAHPTPIGFDATTATETTVRGARAEGYWLDIGVIRGPTETGIKLGDPELQEATVGFFLCNVFVDGAPNDATQLVENNGKQNTVKLHGYTTATGGEWDVVLNHGQMDGTVWAATRRNDLRVKREVLQHADMTKFDPFGYEVIDLSQRPGSLDGFEVTTTGSGDVSLDGEIGAVVHATGPVPTSRAAVHRRRAHDFDRVSFDNPSVLQTSVRLPDEFGQVAWLVWGRPSGPAVGWFVTGEAINGYTHDGEKFTTVPIAGLDGGDAWSLTAFYAPPTDVYFYAEDLVTEESSVRAGGAEASVTVDSSILPPFLPGSSITDPRFAGVISTTLPSGGTAADRVMSITLQSAGGDDTLRWSDWKHHHYPNPQKGGDRA